MKGLLTALLLFAGVQTFAAERFTPQISPDTGGPKVSLRFNRANGTVDVHTGGRWVPARHFAEGMNVNSVELRESPDSNWLFNFWYGDWYGYGSYYPSNYYYYTPSYSLWYGGYSYSPYNWYDRGYYSYYTYYW
jgi:hypothetical protein